MTIENVGFPVREPMLAAGQVDAITGFSFRLYVNLKDRGVPVDDIVVLLMADYGVNLYGNTIIVNPKFAAEKPEAVQAFLRAFLKGLKETVRDPAEAVEFDAQAQRRGQEGRRARAAADGDPRQHRDAGGAGRTATAASTSSRLEQAIDQIGLTHAFKVKPKAADVFDASFLPPGRRSQGQLNVRPTHRSSWRARRHRRPRVPLGRRRPRPGAAGADTVSERVGELLERRAVVAAIAQVDAAIELRQLGSGASSQIESAVCEHAAARQHHDAEPGEHRRLQAGDAARGEHEVAFAADPIQRVHRG